MREKSRGGAARAAGANLEQVEQGRISKAHPLIIALGCTAAQRIPDMIVRSRVPRPRGHALLGRLSSRSCPHKFSVAPMMDYTNQYQRYLMRLMTKKAVRTIICCVSF